ADTIRAVGIGAVFVPEAHRGHGHARALIEAVVGEAEDLGYRAAFLHSEIDPKMYDRLGFVRLRAREHAIATLDLPREGELEARLATDDDLDRMIAWREASFASDARATRHARTRAIWRYFR